MKTFEIIQNTDGKTTWFEAVESKTYFWTKAKVFLTKIKQSHSGNDFVETNKFSSVEEITKYIDKYKHNLVTRKIISLFDHYGAGSRI